MLVVQMYRAALVTSNALRVLSRCARMRVPDSHVCITGLQGHVRLLCHYARATGQVSEHRERA